MTEKTEDKPKPKPPAPPKSDDLGAKKSWDGNKEKATAPKPQTPEKPEATK
jgi:hypothetical protein